MIAYSIGFRNVQKYLTLKIKKIRKTAGVINFYSRFLKKNSYPKYPKFKNKSL